jgi:hypothetical protein
MPFKNSKANINTILHLHLLFYSSHYYIFKGLKTYLLAIQAEFDLGFGNGSPLTKLVPINFDGQDQDIS